MFIGVDGGGTRARAVLVDSAGAVLRRADGSAGIIHAADPAATTRVLAALARDLAGGDRIEVLCCGLAGAGRAVERDAVRGGLVAADVAAHVIVVTDAEVAFADAFDARAGVLLIAGTGSIALARDVTGRTHRVGGWGALLGDEGSGYAIGLAALRAVARAADGRAPQSALSGPVLSATRCSVPHDLIAFAATAAKSDIAALAPLVLQQAARDAGAALIRDEAVAALSELAVAAAAAAALDEPDVALAGGLLGGDEWLRAAVGAEVRRGIPGARMLDGVVDGARGAATLARRSASEAGGV